MRKLFSYAVACFVVLGAPSYALTFETRTLFKENLQTISSPTCTGTVITSTLGTHTCTIDDTFSGYTYDVDMMARTSNESIGISASMVLTNPAPLSEFSRQIPVATTSSTR